MISPEDIEIRRATADDADQIAEIADSWRPDGRPDAELSRDGFLVSDFDTTQYKQLVDQVDYAFVAIRSDQIVGFIIAYNSEQAAVFNDATALQLVTKLDDFVVVKQVAVKRDHTSRGIAHQLYSHLIKRVRGRLIAATVDTPPNVRSRRFHQRLGFTEAFRIPNPDGRVRTVWRYSSEHITDASLYAQYEQAIKLYSHEDSLNWQKLQNYFYITVALSAALGFLLTSTAPVTLIPTRLLGILVITIGVLSSLAFAVALVSGTTYLHVRKQAVCELEDIYINRGGVRVVSTLLRRPIFRRSPTIWTLRLTPLVGVAGWIAMGLYLALAPGT